MTPPGPQQSEPQLHIACLTLATTCYSYGMTRPPVGESDGEAPAQSVAVLIRSCIIVAVALLP